MDFDYSDRTREYMDHLSAFMDEHVFPAEAIYDEEVSKGDPWQPTEVMERLKDKAKELGLWNLFLPDTDHGPGLSNLEYAPLAEIMGRSPIASEACNCQAPDSGNMEILAQFGTREQKDKWLQPLLSGEIRSGFAMTEPAVASSDATNIESSITRDGDEYVLNGLKWWTSGATDPRCKLLIFMGKSNPDAHKYQQQSMVLVPMDTPGVRVVRALKVFGEDHAPHGHAEVSFVDTRVPAGSLLLGEGRGFEIAQARLGPGRIHHCMRLIGQAESALAAMCKRAQERTTFGRKICDHGVIRQYIADSRMDIDQARLLTLKAAHMMDTVGSKAARAEIGMIKVVAPNMAQRVLDRAIQVHGGAGVCQDFGLAASWGWARSLRIADGPDEVHRDQIARLELRKHRSVEKQCEST